MLKYKYFNYLIIGIKNNKEILILFTIAFFVWLIYFVVNFRGLIFPDAMSYAAIARNIIRGDGYCANITTAVNFTHFGKNLFVPLVTPALYPHILALLFKIGGASSYVSGLGSGLFFLISIIPLYLIANRLFGRLAALVTSVIYMFEPTMLMFSISGLTEPVFMFFLLFGFLFLELFLENGKMSYCLLAGVFMGLCKVTRFNAIVFIGGSIAALLLFTEKRHLQICTLFVLGIIITQIPEFARVLFGKTPLLSVGLMNYGAIDGTEQYPFTTLVRILDPMSSWDYIRAYPRDFVYKYLDNVFFYCKNFFVMTNPVVTALFTVSLMSFKSSHIGRVLLFILGLSISLQVALISYNIPIIRYFYIFIPFIIIFGIGFYFKHVYQADGSLVYKGFVFFLVLLVLLTTVRLHTIFILSYRVLFKNYESKESIMIKQQNLIGDFIRQNTEKDDFIATDYISIGWYADRKTLWLPISFEVLETIDSKYKKVDAILVTSASDVKDVTKLTGVAKNLLEWKNILDNPPERLGKYVLLKRGEIKGERFIFYKRNEGK
jgi:hypothetical protein